MKKVTIYRCLADSLEEQEYESLQLIKRLRKKLTVESVHKIRVTTRKLDACLELLSHLGLTNEKLAKEIHQVRKIHGPLRDIHVELEMLKDNDSSINLKCFKRFLLERQKKEEHKLHKKLDEISLKKRQIHFQKIRDEILKKNHLKKNEEALSIMRIHHEKLIAEFEQKKKVFSPELPKTIHEMRIVAKRLRYQNEILKPAMIFSNSNIRQLKYFQDVFGNIQNRSVLLVGLMKFKKKKSTRDPEPIQKYIERLEIEQLALIARVCKMVGKK